MPKLTALLLRAYFMGASVIFWRLSTSRLTRHQPLWKGRFSCKLNQLSVGLRLKPVGVKLCVHHAAMVGLSSISMMMRRGMSNALSLYLYCCRQHVIAQLSLESVHHRHHEDSYVKVFIDLSKNRIAARVASAISPTMSPPDIRAPSCMNTPNNP